MSEDIHDTTDPTEIPSAIAEAEDGAIPAEWDLLQRAPTGADSEIAGSITETDEVPSASLVTDTAIDTDMDRSFGQIFDPSRSEAEWYAYAAKLGTRNSAPTTAEDSWDVRVSRAARERLEDAPPRPPRGDPRVGSRTDYRHARFNEGDDNMYAAVDQRGNPIYAQTADERDIRERAASLSVTNSLVADWSAGQRGWDGQGAVVAKMTPAEIHAKAVADHDAEKARQAVFDKAVCDRVALVAKERREDRLHGVLEQARVRFAPARLGSRTHARDAQYRTEDGKLTAYGTDGDIIFPSTKSEKALHDAVIHNHIRNGVEHDFYGVRTLEAQDIKRQAHARFDAEAAEARPSGGRILSTEAAVELLSYADIHRQPGRKDTANQEFSDAQTYTRESAEGQQATAALQDLVAEHGPVKLTSTAIDMQNQLFASLDTLGLRPSEASHSLSWAYWDMAQQHRQAQRVAVRDPDSPNAAEALDGTINGHIRYEDIVHQQIGWEVSRQIDASLNLSHIPVRNPHDREVIPNIIITGDRDQTGNLRSHTLIRLGYQTMRVAAQQQVHETSPAAERAIAYRHL